LRRADGDGIIGEDWGHPDRSRLTDKKYCNDDESPLMESLFDRIVSE
jgi:hypothetical protein